VCQEFALYVQTIPEFIGERKYDGLFMNKNAMISYTLSMKSKVLTAMDLRRNSFFAMSNIPIN